MAGSTTIQMFEMFSQLPLELRRKIWVLSLPGPRIVKIVYDKQKQECWSPARVPAAVHACRESRIEAKRYFELAFGPKTTHALAVGASAKPSDDLVGQTVTGDVGSDQNGRLYFDFAMDTLYIVQFARAPSPMTTEEEYDSWCEDPFYQDRETWTIIKSAADLNRVRRAVISLDTLHGCLRMYMEYGRGATFSDSFSDLRGALIYHHVDGGYRAMDTERSERGMEAVGKVGDLDGFVMGPRREGEEDDVGNGMSDDSAGGTAYWGKLAGLQLRTSYFERM